MKIVIFFIFMVLTLSFAHAEVGVIRTPEESPDFTYQVQSYPQIKKDIDSQFQELDQFFIDRELSPITLPDGFSATKTSLSFVDRIYSGELGKTVVFIKAGVIPSLATLMRTSVQINGGYLHHFKQANGLSIAVFVQTENWENALDIFSKLQTKLVSVNKIKFKNEKPINFWSLFLMDSAQAQDGTPCAADLKLTSNSVNKLIAVGEAMADRSPLIQHISGCAMSALKGVWSGSGGVVIGGAKSIGNFITSPIESGKKFWQGTTELWNVTKKFFNDFEGEARKLYSTFDSLDPLVKTKIACEVIGTVGGGVLLSYLSGGVMASSVMASLLLKVKTAIQEVMALAKYQMAKKSIAAAELAIEKMDSQTDLYSIPRGPRDFSLAANKKVLEDLKNLPIKALSAKKEAGVSDGDIQKLYSQVSDHPVASLSKMHKYELKEEGKGFCYGRATAAHIKALMNGADKDSIRKVWALGKLDHGQHYNDPWAYHVTTIVRDKKGEWFAIDPVLGKVVSVDDWYKEMKKTDLTGNMRVFVTEPKRFGPSSPKYKNEDLKKPRFENYFNDLMKSFQDEAKALISERKGQ